MTIDPALLGFGLAVFAGYAVQTATGFGSMLVCVTFGAQLLGLETVVQLGVPLSFVQLGYVVLRDHDGILWRLLLRRVLPWMLLGMAIAFLLLAEVQSAWLGVAFGMMVFILSARELRRLRTADAAALSVPISRPKSVAALLGAGIVHGIYATGGPMLVYALGREGIDKRAFRSTLSVVWIVLNVVLVTRFAMSGAYTRAVLLDVGVLLPAVPIGIAAGEWIHHRADERRFKAAVFVLLIAAAISLIARYGAAL